MSIETKYFESGWEGEKGDNDKDYTKTITQTNTGTNTLRNYT